MKIVTLAECNIDVSIDLCNIVQLSQAHHFSSNRHFTHLEYHKNGRFHDVKSINLRPQLGLCM